MIEVLQYTPVNKGYLKGLITVRVPKWGNFIIHEIAFFEKGNSRWITFPSKQYEKDGQKKFFAYNRFECSKIAHAFQKSVLTALEIFLVKNPQVLECTNF